MTELEKRPWFRFHLLTAVLTMLAASILLGIELGPLRSFMCEAWDYNRQGVLTIVAGHLALVALVAVICEKILRYRESRNP